MQRLRETAYEGLIKAAAGASQNTAFQLVGSMRDLIVCLFALLPAHCRTCVGAAYASAWQRITRTPAGVMRALYDMHVIPFVALC